MFLRFIMLLAFCATPPVSASVVDLSSEKQVNGGIQYQIKFDFVDRQIRKPLPFELMRGLIVFRIKVAGKEVWALLDNKSDTSLIDLNFAKQAGFTIDDKALPLNTPGDGKLFFYRTEAVTVEIPNQLEATAPLSATDLGPTSAFVGKPITLVIGQEYFLHLGVAINFANRTIRMGPSGALKPNARLKAVKVPKNKPELEVLVDNRPYILTLDLGANLAITLLDRTGFEVGRLKTEAATETIKVGTSDGSITEVYPSKGHVVNLADIVMKDVTIAHTTNLHNLQDGLLGVRLLRRFPGVVIDLKDSKLWILTEK